MDPRFSPDPDRERYSYPTGTGGSPQRLPESNSGTVLAIAILSFFCCGVILGPIAWTMANNTLTDMEFNRVDSSQRGTVEEGRIVAIVSTLFHVAILVIYGLIYSEQQLEHPRPVSHIAACHLVIPFRSRQLVTS